MDVVHHLQHVGGQCRAFGISAIAHAMLIAGVFITAGVFETAKRRPQYFGGLARQWR